MQILSLICIVIFSLVLVYSIIRSAWIGLSLLLKKITLIYKKIDSKGIIIFLKNLSIKRKSVSLKPIFETTREYLKIINNSPKALMLLVIFCLGIITPIVNENNIISQEIKNTYSIISLPVILVIFIITPIYLAKSNSKLDRFVSTLVLCLILLISTIPILGICESQDKNQMMAAAIVFSIGALFTFYVGARNYQKKVVIVWSLLLYVYILIIGSIAFGGYFLNLQDKVNFPANYLEAVKLYFKEGVVGFFEFPSNLELISFIQFMLGKCLDLLVLGFVVAKILEFDNTSSIGSKS